LLATPGGLWWAKDWGNQTSHASICNIIYICLYIYVYIYICCVCSNP
jgi:hypothetical protein